MWILAKFMLYVDGVMLYMFVGIIEFFFSYDAVFITVLIVLLMCFSVLFSIAVCLL